MRKYFRIIVLSLEETLTYRFNFLISRFRSFISTVALVVFWQAVYGDKLSILGYDKPQMMAYVIGIAILKNFVLGTKSADLAGQIRSGELSRTLVKPWKMIGYWLSRDLAEKFIGVIFSILEIFLVVKLFNIAFYLPKEASTYLLFSVFILLSTFTYFLVSMILSVSGFWTEDVWATRWLFGIIFLEFMSGSLFPIDVLPKTLVTIFNLTPFPYLIFYPIKIWNEQLGSSEITRIFLITLFWLFLSWFVYRKLWSQGIKKFGAYGG